MISTHTPAGHPPIPITKALVLDPWLEPLPLPGPLPIVSYSQDRSKVESVASSLDTTVVDGKNHEPPRILVLNSEAFTLWKDHYIRLQEVINAWEPQGGRLLTLGIYIQLKKGDAILISPSFVIVASQHISFSDFQLVPLLQKKGAQTFMDIISQLSIGFLDGQLESVLETISTRKMEVEIIGKRKDGRPKRKLVGSVGDVIVD
jgi:platelet-activating factor acetylhydrolase